MNKKVTIGVIGFAMHEPVLTTIKEALAMHDMEPNIISVDEAKKTQDIMNCKENNTHQIVDIRSIKSEIPLTRAQRRKKERDAKKRKRRY